MTLTIELTLLSTMWVGLSFLFNFTYLLYIFEYYTWEKKMDRFSFLFKINLWWFKLEDCGVCFILILLSTMVHCNILFKNKNKTCYDKNF